MAAHEELKKKISKSIDRLGFEFARAAEIENVRNLDRTWAKVYYEMTIRYATGQTTRRGAERMEHFRFDSVVFVHPGIAGLNRQQCFTVGIEIKGQLSDLTADNKILFYLGWTDFFYIGVPESLVDSAIAKAAIDDRIGVVDIDNNIIIKIPVRQKVSIENKCKMLEQVIYSQPFETFSGDEALRFMSENYDEQNNKIISISDGESIYEYKDVSMARIMCEYDGTDRMIKQRLGQPSSQAEGTQTKDNQDNQGNKFNISKDDTLNEEKLNAIKAMKEAREQQRQKLAEEVANKAGELPETTRIKLSTLSNKTQAAYHAIRSNPDIKSMDLENIIGVSQATAQRLVTDLKDSGLIERVGSRKTGGYRVKEMDAGKPSYLRQCTTCNLYKSLLAKKEDLPSPTE